MTETRCKDTKIYRHEYSTVTPEEAHKYIKGICDWCKDKKCKACGLKEVPPYETRKDRNNKGNRLDS